MDLRSPAALLSALDGLQAFCREVKARTGDKGLLELAEIQSNVLNQMHLVVDHYFLNEGRSPHLDQAPHAEIARRPAMADSEFPQTPIFIIGNRRSGTTLLAYLLNTSPQIAALPESFLASGIAGCDEVFSVGLRAKGTLEEPFPMFAHRLGQLVDRIYSDCAKRSGKSRWASKELIIPHRLDTLDLMFDYRSRFVYAVRHGLDVAWSCACRFPMMHGLPRGSKSSLNVEVYLQEWIENNERTMDFVERNPERCMVVRYEEFVQNPQNIGRELFAFLSEEFHDELLDRMVDQPLRSMGDNKIIRTRGKITPAESQWPSWPKGLLATLARKANPTLERLGYPAVEVR